MHAHTTFWHWCRTGCCHAPQAPHPPFQAMISQALYLFDQSKPWPLLPPTPPLEKLPPPVFVALHQPSRRLPPLPMASRPFPSFRLCARLGAATQIGLPRCVCKRISSHVTRHTSHVTRHTSQVCELLGRLPLDKPPSEKDRKLLVDELVVAFPEAAKRMATVTRVCKQQVQHKIGTETALCCCVIV